MYLRLFKLFDKGVYLMQLCRDVNVLGAMWLARTAADAVVSLSQAVNASVEPDEIFAPVLPIVWIAGIFWQSALVLTFIIMHEDSGNIDAEGARHAIFAVVAGNGLDADDFLCNFFKKDFVGVGDRMQRAET